MKKLTILYDHQIFDIQNYGGISRYFINLIKGISDQGCQAKISVLQTNNYYLDNYKTKTYTYRLFKKMLNKVKVSTWHKNFSRLRILFNDFDVFHPTYYDPYLKEPYFLAYIKKPFVITVHDMIHELYPHYFPEGDFTKENKLDLIKKATHVIAISETTKKDIVRLLDINADKITVVYHGHTSIANQNDPALLLPERYILFVGGRDHYKNFKTFAIAAAKVIQADADLMIVCSGGGKFTDEEITYLQDLGIHNSIQRYDVSDDQLYWLYKRAECFVYPSLYEGFGLPILEAYEARCPVILSETPSFIEVAQQAALFFDPSDPNEISLQIQRLIEDRSLRADLIKQGSERLKYFNIQNCVNQTLKVYERCVKFE